MRNYVSRNGCINIQLLAYILVFVLGVNTRVVQLQPYQQLMGMSTLMMFIPSLRRSFESEPRCLTGHQDV